MCVKGSKGVMSLVHCHRLINGLVSEHPAFPRSHSHNKNDTPHRKIWWFFLVWLVKWDDVGLIAVWLKPKMFHFRFHFLSPRFAVGKQLRCHLQTDSGCRSLRPLGSRSPGAFWGRSSFGHHINVHFELVIVSSVFSCFFLLFLVYAAYADLALVLGCPSGVERLVFVLRPSRAGSQAPQGDPDGARVQHNHDEKKNTTIRFWVPSDSWTFINPAEKTGAGYIKDL